MNVFINVTPVIGERNIFQREERIRNHRGRRREEYIYMSYLIGATDKNRGGLAAVLNAGEFHNLHRERERRRKKRKEKK